MFKCKFCGKEFNKKEQLGGHVIWCKDNPNRSGKNNLIPNFIKNNELRDNLFCQYCGKKCKNMNSLKQHEIRCSINPNRIEVNSNFIKYNNELKDKKRIPWNKGLTKENDKRLKKQGETYRQRVKEGKIKKPGGCKEGSVKYHYKYGRYNGIRCDSSWELAFLVYCLENNISIKRNSEKFPYYYNNEKHYFYPDFIINNNEFVEIKGLQDELWEIKKQSFDNVIFIFRKDMTKYLSYVRSKYGKNFWEVLYDK